MKRQSGILAAVFWCLRINIGLEEDLKIVEVDSKIGYHKENGYVEGELRSVKDFAVFLEFYFLVYIK